jgi:hypothetical protein
MDMGLSEAVHLLAGPRLELIPHVEALLESPTAASDSLPVLDDLLQDFPRRVRATHGTERAALLQAARVVLIAKAVLREGAAHEEAFDLIEILISDDRYTHLHAWASDGSGDSLPARGGFRYTVTGQALRGPNSYYHDAATALAASCPEFALAAGLPCAALSERLGDRPRAGLAGFGAMLAEFAGQGTRPTAGRALLRTPIASLDSPGPRLPSLAEGYISPRFGLSGWLPGIGEAIASDKWWEQRPSHDGLERFLAAHLLSTPALLSPLLVLGHPGAGKSLLTKLLTARLPAREFRPLRVELRHMPAELDVQTQLEHALRLTTGRSVNWPDWSEEQPGVTPVVLLDGFDELLQAGAQRLDSARQWGYLRDVQRFQLREAELGRPLVVIVTSRTVVADRAEVPEDSLVLRLEPFGASETDRWLTVWNTTNAAYLEQRGLRPLSPADLRPHRDLASQPLLLLMLALYDAVDNGLQRLGDDESMSRTQLYDRLLTEFVRRQVDKDGSLPPHEQAAAIDRELHRLSVIALGMFHRGAQAISGEEADRDLRALADPVAHGEQAGSGLVFGRFFFVHEAQAVVTEQRLRSYEFMHATFGEHLAARLIEQALRRLADRREGDGTAGLDDGELYALLSFTPLTDRAQLVENLWSMLAAWPEDRARHRLQGLLVSLFRAAEWHSGQRGGPEHAPVRVTRAYRDAVYEVNLLLIAVVAAGEVHASEFLGTEGLGDAWRRRTMMWRSQLSEESWKLFSSTLDPDRCWRPDPDDGGELRPDMRLSTIPTLSLDHHLGWMLGTVHDPDAHDIGPAVITSNDAAAEVFTQLTFLGDRHAELLLHAVYPLLRRMPHTLLMYRTDHDGRPRSAAQSLVALLMGQARDLSATALPDLYAQCVTAVAMLPSGEADTYLETVCRRLAADIPLLVDEDLLDVLRELSECVAELGTGLTGGLREALLDCVYAAVGRVDRDVSLILAELQKEVELRDTLSHESSPLRALLHLVQAGRSSSTWRWSSPVGGTGLDGEFDDILDDLDLSAFATHYPAAVIALLRVAAELDLTDWLAARAPELLAALPAPAFGLLRPSDLRYLRPALRPGAYEEEFAEVERIWGRTGDQMPPASRAARSSRPRYSSHET